MTVRCRVQVCGTVSLLVDGRDLGAAVPAGQARTLLVHLVITRIRATERSTLPTRLWSGEPPASSERVVAALLSRLRSALGADLLPPRTDPQLHLPEPAHVDLERARQAVHTADAAVSAADWTAAWTAARIALGVAQRDFLPGVDLPWVVAERERLRDIRCRAWEAVGEAGLGLGGAEIVSSRRAGRELIGEEPLRESGYRLAMRAALAQGNTAEAIAIYDTLRGRLAADLGIDPGPESRALFEQTIASTSA